MTGITSTSGCLHSEVVRLLFLQDHRETDRFFEVSGVHLVQLVLNNLTVASSTTPSYRRATVSSQIKSKVGNILAKDAALRITLNIDGTPMTSKSHTHPSHQCVH